MAPRWLSNGQSAWGHGGDRTLTPKGMALAAFVILLVGIAAGYGLQSATSSDPEVAQATDNPVIDPSIASMKTAPQTEEGAVRAVTSYITGFASLALMSTPQQREALDGVLSPSADPNLRGDLTRVLTNARERLIGVGSLQRANSTRLVISPASYKVDMLSPTEARVQVWFLSVFVDANGQTAESSWATNDIRVQWSDHWRMATFAAKTGPTPTLYSSSENPSTYAEVASVFNGFKAYRYAPAPSTPVAAN